MTNISVLSLFNLRVSNANQHFISAKQLVREKRREGGIRFGGDEELGVIHVAIKMNEMLTEWKIRNRSRIVEVIGI